MNKLTKTFIRKHRTTFTRTNEILIVNQNRSNSSFEYKRANETHRGHVTGARLGPAARAHHNSLLVLRAGLTVDYARSRFRKLELNGHCTIEPFSIVCSFTIY